MWARWTGRTDGDLRLIGLAGAAGLPPVAAGGPLYRLRQVHGAEVIAVGETAGAVAPAWRAGPDGLPPEGDALVAGPDGGCLAVLSADCGAVALAGAGGVHGAVHVGWRGLVAGVLERALAAIEALGAGPVVAGLGPCIGPCCYAFSPGDLDAVAAAGGDVVRARRADGSPSLDLPGAIRAALAAAGAAVVVDDARCTVCGPGSFSFRRDGTESRQALLVWSES
ncbi:MAG: laccase domain-containing protein [Acidimicrobiales bacterium]